MSVAPAKALQEDVEFQADYNAVMKHVATKGYQVGALLTPPIYVIYGLVRRRPFTVNRFLRATWIGNVVGAITALGLGWGRMRDATPESVKDRRTRLQYNTSQIRTDDHSIIGSVLFAVLTPALLWKRASLVNLILGGAGIGSAVGVLVHLGRSFAEGEDVKPEGMRDIVEGAVTGDK